LVVRVFGFVSTRQQLQQPSRRFLNLLRGTRRTKRGLGFLFHGTKTKTILGRNEERAGIESKKEKIFSRRETRILFRIPLLSHNFKEPWFLVGQRKPVVL
jgi:hypothetical protein